VGYSTAYVKDIQHKLNLAGFHTTWVNGYLQTLQEDGDLGAVTKDRVRAFQQAWAVYLAPDGDPGQHTLDALNFCVWVGGLISPHFRARETDCTHCGLVNAKRELLSADEYYREKIDPNGMNLVSVTRCPVHNRDVGGARNSLHLWGGASDLIKQVHVDTVLEMRRFSGIEISHDGWVVHVDVRHLISGANFTGSTVDNPAIFRWPTTLVKIRELQAQRNFVCHM
jgi:hypothetical protein